MSVAFDSANTMTAKDSWSSAPLRDLCEFHNGLWKGKKEPFETATVIRNTNFTSGGRIDLTDVAILEVEARQLAKRGLQKNDIIIEKSGGGPKQPVGRVVLFDLDTDEKYSFSNFTSAIRVARPSKVDPVYLHRVLYWWYTSGRTEPLQSHSTGIRNLDFNAYKELEVPLPPLEEQKRIVAVLDQAFAALDRARAHAEANLADVNELFGSCRGRLLTDGAFHWKEVFLSAACVVERGSSPRPIKQFLTNDPDGVNWIKIGDTKVGSKFVTSTHERITREGSKKSRAVYKGDFILTNSMTYGRPYIMAIDGFIHDGWFVLRLKDEINRDFFFHLLSSTIVQKQFESLAAGAVVKNISSELVKKAVLRFPKLDEQERIAAELDRLAAIADRLRTKYSKKLQALANLRQSLLQKAFSGELT